MMSSTESETTDFDLVVIGGGINGAGIARDAAERGLRVLLLEQNDFGSGTSSWSSRLIHGGLRYLEYAEFPLVFESLRERRLLQRLAPHLVHRLPITIPVYSNGRRPLWLIRLGMIAYDMLSIGKTIPRHRILDRQQTLDALPGLDSRNLVGGARYFDAQVEYAERLVLENVIAASNAGAEVRNYCPVVAIDVDSNNPQVLRYRSHADNVERTVQAKAIVNASGPWVDRVLATVNQGLPEIMGGTKGSHIVVPRFTGHQKNAIYAESAADGRPYFIIPWNEQTLIGTTDLRYRDEPGDASPSGEEIDYLLGETNRLFPDANLTRDSIHYAYAGVRPLPRQSSGPESAITRKHIIRQHPAPADRLLSIIGGKLTTYRNLAEQAVDAVVRLLGLKAKDCLTRQAPLPGGYGLDEARAALDACAELSPAGRRRLLRIYGGRAVQILAIAAEAPNFLRTLDDENLILAAEVVHAIDFEFAKSLEDIVHRRMMTGLDADQGKRFITAIAACAGDHLAWTPEVLRQQLQQLEKYQRRFRVS